MGVHTSLSASKLLEACFQAGNVMRLNTQDSFFLHWDMINYGEAGPSRSYLNGWGKMLTYMQIFSQKKASALLLSFLIFKKNQLVSVFPQ